MLLYTFYSITSASNTNSKSPENNLPKSFSIYIYVF